MKGPTLIAILVLSIGAGCSTGSNGTYMARYNRTIKNPALSSSPEEEKETAKLYSDVPSYVEALHRVAMGEKPRGVQRAPRLVKMVKPECPPNAKTLGMPATVVVNFIVDSQGNVVLPRVLKSSNDGFNPYAIAAVKRWRFKPATIDGHPVNCMMSVPIVFKRR